MDRVGVSPVPPTPSVFPADVVAIIYKPARSAMTSGKARTRQWKLRFEPRSPQFIEPLMGWTGSDDTLSQVELTFPSAEAAVAYARRQGLRDVLHGDANVRQIGHVNRANSSQLPSTPRPCRPSLASS
jgi:ETC complex I subunit conserved region